MLTKTKITLVAALLLGSASGAFAIDLSPNGDPSARDADSSRSTATTPARKNHRNAFARQTPARVNRPTEVVRPVSSEELAWMDRASRTFY